MNYDIAVVGGGPAGITAAIYGVRAGKKVILFEGDALGGLLNEVDYIENYPGFVGSGKDLAQMMGEQLKKLGCEIKGKYVLNVIKLGEDFMITAGADVYQAKKVIYCGGYKRSTYGFAQPYEGKGVSYCATCDGMFFRGKTVALVGSGYDAEEEALFLQGLCKRVNIVSSKPILTEGDNVEKHFPYRLTGIEGQDKVERIIIENEQTKERKTIEVDGVFIAMGGSTKSVLSDLKTEGFIKANEGETEVKGLFVAGDIEEGSAKQVVIACAAGARSALKAIKQLNLLKN